MDSPSALDLLEGFAEQSTAPHGVIPAEQGRALIDEHDDEDVSRAGQELNSLLVQAYSVSQSHIIALKKRLLEEKRIEMVEMERKYLNHVDSLKNEIQQLQLEISNQVTELGESRQTKENFHVKAAIALSHGGVKYSSPFAILKIFQAWRDETRSTHRANKLDRVARSFARKYTLSRVFAAMVLGLQVRKAHKQNAEAKFKFDSVTTEMITSYEGQLQAMKEDLREAYLSIEAEQLRRQQLEEDLRRLFLRNMTAMNFEALSLFQNSHTMVDTIPAVLEEVVEIGSPPRPVRRDLQHSERKSRRASSVPRTSTNTPSSTPQHATHHHTDPHTGSTSTQKLNVNTSTHYQPTPQQMERQIEQLISSTHTHIPHVTHANAAHAHNNTLHMPHVRPPPVHTPQPPHPLSHNNAHLSLEAENSPFNTPNAKNDSFYTLNSPFGVQNQAVATPSNPYYHPESPHQLSTVYRENISSTSKLAHNTQVRKSSFSGSVVSVGSGVSSVGNSPEPIYTKHTSSSGRGSSTSASTGNTKNSTSVQGTPSSARRPPTSAVKRSPLSK